MLYIKCELIDSSHNVLQRIYKDTLIPVTDHKKPLHKEFKADIKAKLVCKPDYSTKFI